MPGKRKVGRPKYEITDEQFKTLIGLVKIQCTQEEICDVLGITDKTLNLALKRRGEGNFSELYKKNLSHGRASLRRNQWKAADKGVPSILIWMGKQYLGQKDQVETKATHEVQAFDGWTIERTVKPD
jgi:hypothetical protein